MIKLSIIIPAYNAEPYIDELMKCLAPQMNDEMEVIVVDDGSKFPFLAPYPKIKVFRKENGGVSSARNLGLKKAKGEYIAFVDADDKLAPNYVEKVLKAIESKPDTVYLSWKSMDGRFGKIIKNQQDKFGPANRCVWNRVFSKDYISGMKFDETMQVAEDDDFLKRLPEAKSHAYISEPMYFYRVGVKGGLCDRRANGEFDEPDITTQVVLYYGWVQQIGGVETFFYNFCQKMSQYYDIVILYDRCDMAQLLRLQRMVQCVKNGEHKIKCDTLIVNGVFDHVPKKVTAKQTIRLVHTCKYEPFGIMSVPDDCDKKIFVSKASRTSFEEKGDIIPNMPGEGSKKAFLFLSATRLTNEKGYNRMLKMAKRMRQLEIPFLWIVFTAVNNRTFPEGFIKMAPTYDIKPYIKMADCVVQLSDIEAFCYTIQEALQLGTPVISTPLPVLPEVGFKSGLDGNGFTVPFEIDEMTDDDFVNMIMSLSSVKQNLAWKDNTESIIKKWRKVLGNTTPTHSYQFDETAVMIRCKVRFQDVVLNRRFSPGEIQIVDAERGKYLVETLKAWEYVR